LLAMVDNDKAYELNECGVFETIASKPAPTGMTFCVLPGIA
jgi:hypothetical protein